MSYRAGLSGFGFPASWLTGAGDNFCPSVSSCWRLLHSNPHKYLEAARQSLPGFALAVAVPWCLSRNSPLNRSAGDLLTGSFSLILRSGLSVSNLRRAPARGFYVCPCWREPIPFGAKRVPFEAKPTASRLPGPLIPPLPMQGNALPTRTSRLPSVPAVLDSIEYP